MYSENYIKSITAGLDSVAGRLEGVSPRIALEIDLMSDWIERKAAGGETFQEWFKKDMKNRPKRVKTRPPEKKNVTLKMYRGMDPVSLEKLSNNQYKLNPEKSEQQSLWFTHILINSRSDPKEYAKDSGSTLLTYPLKCIQHIQTVEYDDGSTYDQIPEEIIKKTVGFEDCKYYAGYELPKGWFFSYKNQKFAVCKIPLVVSANMLKPKPSI